MNKKILQIIPAVGWYAKYDLVDKGELLSPLVCWAHCQEENYVSIEGMDVDGTGNVDFCDEEHSFTGYIYKGEGEDVRGGMTSDGEIHDGNGAV